ncbi:hypothetical protein RvY_08045 [Ramazzottius varieornatus]|uniref:Uncharacterized protein n=1 Tax=Ramazzottius varieornatus TaxID=947166 RepID=A0A1D1V980_RAMVA|nr:hypothetical protein RvY_08045 [Ramazzottius varieornatus]
MFENVEKLETQEWPKKPCVHSHLLSHVHFVRDRPNHSQVSVSPRKNKPYPTRFPSPKPREV